MIDLTDEEKEILAELDEKQMIKTCARTHPNWSEEEHRRAGLLKGLVYKDVINFTFDKNHEGYVFVTRKKLGKF